VNTIVNSTKLGSQKEELPLITIAMPVKNRSWCIGRVLKAIESIEYPKEKIKLIFVDGCSTDETFDIITEWRDKVKKKGYYDVVLIQAPANIPQARNLCIEHMKGDYLLYWDSDVVPPPELLLEMVKLIEKNRSIGIIGADYIYEPSLRVQYVPTVNKETNAVYMGFTLIRGDIFKVAGKFNELLSVGEDTEFCIRVKERTEYIIYWAPKPVLHMRRPADVAKPGTLRNWLRYNFTVRAKEYYLSWKSLPRFLKLRIMYWTLWPWVLALATYMSALKNVVAALFLVLYILASAYPVIRQKSIIMGFKLWMKNNVLTGLALSYGILTKIVRNLMRRKRAGMVAIKNCGNS
jgi:glycosyltransferase involved in cell wall biosynthesis